MQTAMQICQDRHDSKLPAEHAEYDEQDAAEVAQVLAMESELVPFFDKRATRSHGHISGFALNASEAMAQAAGHECFDVQLALAVGAGNYELARAIFDKCFMPVLQAEALHMVVNARRAERVVWE
ncbi:hypothetical protein SAMN05216178_4018 [Pseudomonas saponiphila]|uniref:Uncharacterized protein n=1 Tax=Pseudomonas saponiphila TaxID=556534 RepID=A0A1H4R311_9PSED|nr:hypothetical protein [Pseudomonas saponiphila]SEC26272.1 hypothetical protein SAMN05216178_4018 [Pseudomonas saponiphila]